MTGAIAGIVVLIMSVTGVLLMYEKQITNWADMRDYRVAPATQNAPRLSIETLLAKAAEERPAAATSVTVRAASDLPVSIGYQGGTSVFINQHTGDILGDGAPRVRAFFRSVTDWHRWLGRKPDNRTISRAITGASNLGFLFLVMSGFYLWWPSKWSKPVVRNVTWFKRGLSGRARNFNWHNVIGFWCAVPLFVVVLSAVVISYTWAGNLVYRLAGEEPPAPRTAPPPSDNAGQKRDAIKRSDAASSSIGLNALLLRAEQHTADWKSITLQIPQSPDGPATFTIDQGNGGQPQKRGQLSLDRKTGEVMKWEPFSSLSRGRQWRSFLRFAHTGEVAGVVGQSIAGLASFGASFLIWTGLSLALRRLRGWWRRRRMSDAVAAKVTDELIQGDQN